MGFDALIEKVRQAEVALEAKERQTGADWRQVKSSWRALWTPGRIVLAGLAAGFVVGRAEPFKKSAISGTLQLVSTLGSLFAGGSAQAAADEAAGAKQAAEAAGRGTGEGSGSANDDDAAGTPPFEIPEAFRGSGHL